jgi:transposase
VNLENRVRVGHPLRQVKTAIDFGVVREEVAHCYGRNGNKSVPPEVILKMMFLLFFDDIKSERELMELISERLDYLWFLDYGLDDKVPDYSVLSKARSRWGKEVFESLFVRTVAQCVEAGLVRWKQAACGCQFDRCKCVQGFSYQKCASTDRSFKARLLRHREQAGDDQYTAKLPGGQ